jgi:hypothetical protein
MDVVSTIFSLVNKGIEAISWAQSKGYIGGSTNWVPAAQDAIALWDRGKALFTVLMSNPSEYDQIDKLPQAEKEAQIAKRLYPTKLNDLVEQVRKEMTG